MPQLIGNAFEGFYPGTANNDITDNDGFITPLREYSLAIGILRWKFTDMMDNDIRTLDEQN